MGLCRGIILRNDIMELYYRIIFMKRILGMARTSLEPPGIPRTPWARSWDPQGRPWDPWVRPWDPRGAPLGPPWEPHGPQKYQYLNKYTAPEAFDCCVRTCLLLPIAPRPPQGRFVYKNDAKSNKLVGGTVPCGKEATHRAPGPGCPPYIRHRYT